jgi:hypothetical protein
VVPRDDRDRRHSRDRAAGDPLAWLEAARICPTVVIRITDEATGKQLFP